MSPRPVIFISAVSKELKSARQLVANTLTFLGYEPEWQDIFSTGGEDLRAMLRRRIDASKGVVQLVGHCYGAEPPQPDETFGRVSYTQYEALYARQRGKKVWYLIVDETFPADAYEPEDEEKQKLQKTYRERVKADAHLFHGLSSKEGLEASVLKLRDDLTHLRRGVKQWAAFVAILLVLIAAAVAWLLHRQQAGSEKQDTTNRELVALREQMAALEQGVNALPAVQQRITQEQPGQQPEQIEARTYGELGKQLGIAPTKLKAELPRMAEQIRNASDKPFIERANAAYVTKDYPEAERLALAAADEAQRAAPPKTSDAIKAFELAGNAAKAHAEYADAMRHLREAEKLSNRARGALEWARVQWGIANILQDQGQYAAAANVYRDVVKEFEQTSGPEHPSTLSARNTLALILGFQGKYAEAEAEHRAVLNLQEKALGPDHPETLATRSNLALGLGLQGKYAEAEAEHRVVLRLREKVLGPEHPDTLATRNNLAIALASQGRYSETEAEFRAVLKLEEKVLGPEHPSVLAIRSNLAVVLSSQGKYAAAEAEHRAVLKLREKVLGPEHPDTLGTCYNLALCLMAQGKKGEAGEFAKRAVEGVRKVLGAEHPVTKRDEKLWRELQGGGR